MTPKAAATRYAIARGYVVTANDDGSIPLSTVIVAKQDEADIEGSALAALVAQANAAPELLAAELLAALVELLKHTEPLSRPLPVSPDTIGEAWLTRVNQMARAAIAAATGRKG